MRRFLKDELLKVSQALPAAGASVTSPSIPVGKGEFDGVDLLVEIPATPNLVDDKSVTVKLQDSADNQSFSDVAEYAPIVVTGAGGLGAGAKSLQIRMPRNVREHIALHCTTEAAGGDNTDVAAVLQLVF